MSVTGLTALPSVSSLNLLTPQASTAHAAATGTATSSTSGGGLTGTTTGTTFLNLLVKELQNQDPSAPMDSTAMVGQMISLNQLDQLISINQNLTSATSSGTSAAATTQAISGTSVSSSSLMAAQAALMNTASPSNSINAASLAASNPSTVLDFSTLNPAIGGK
jgi:flagellar basal-body rod modification protein FlgD